MRKNSLDRQPDTPITWFIGFTAREFRNPVPDFLKKCFKKVSRKKKHG